MKAQQQRRSKHKDNGRRVKKKISVLAAERVEYVDYKDVNLLRRFMSDRAKIRARRVSGNDSQQQREVARAIKNAREMALLPYTSRVTTQRGPRADRGDRGDRVIAAIAATVVIAATVALAPRRPLLRLSRAPKCATSAPTSARR